MRRVAVILGSRREVGGAVALPPTLPKSDRAAIGLALKRFGGQVDAYCLRNDEEALRYALAAGATTATRLDDVVAIDFDVVLIGSGGAEPWGDLLLALLAERKQCAMVFEVLDVKPTHNGMTVTRDLGRGGREILALSPPAVLGIAENASQLLYVSRYRRQMAPAPRLAPSAELAVDPLAAGSGPWEPARPRVKIGNLAAKTAGSATGRMQALLGIAADTARADAGAHVIVADAATCARHLLRFLRHHGIIATAVNPEQEAASRTSPPDDRQGPEASIRTRYRRGLKPLERKTCSPERQPRPLQPSGEPSQQTGLAKRGPHPIGQTTPRRVRGPRPVDRDPQGSGKPV
jgi:electron transfer flavoprotein alpha/beta subunit